MTNMFLLFAQQNFIIDPAKEHFIRRVWNTGSQVVARHVLQHLLGDDDQLLVLVDRRTPVGITVVLRDG